MKRTILNKLMVQCPFQETLDDTELVDGCSFPVPKLKIGHIRADHDGWRWHNTVWPCHSSLTTPEICMEIDRVYDKLTAADALKDLPTLRQFCAEHMDACIDKEFQQEFSFFYVGKHCDFWVKLTTREKDYNLYLNAYSKGRRLKKYYEFLERLRESGETNMYGAVGNLMDAFPELRYDRKKAEEIHLAWIASFDREEDESC